MAKHKKHKRRDTRKKCNKKKVKANDKLYHAKIAASDQQL